MVSIERDTIRHTAMRYLINTAVLFTYNVQVCITIYNPFTQKK